MHGKNRRNSSLTRRASLQLVGAAMAAWSAPAFAQGGRPFPQWVEQFRPRALARGVSDATYSRVMLSLKPDTSVYALDRSQPEFTEKVWQYINRRVSDWRVTVGREKIREYEPLLRSEEHTSELQSLRHLVCRLLL